MDRDVLGCKDCFLDQIANVARSQILTAVDKLAIIKRLLDEYEEANGMSFDA